MASFKRARRSAANAAFVGFCYFVTFIAIVTLALILWSLIGHGVEAFQKAGLNIFTMPTPAPESAGGLLNAIVGSLVLCVLAMIIAVLIGIIAGTWLSEYGGHGLWRPYAGVVRFVNDILLSAPSVLVGLFVYQILVAPFHGFSALSGAVALALIAVPIITRTTEDVLKLQPTTLRESGVALGTPMWTTIQTILWRSAGSGILTGALLAFARISGETAPLLFTAFGNQYFSIGLHKPAFGLTQPIASLPQVIFQFANSPYDDWQRLAWAGALIVAVAVLGTNILARILTRERNPQ
ncbi:MAG TPA: phosphate ABC transporter permease PstA [Caulobacteraceae bacterium]|nr:phosphate ABC transporter permease PstA [Caulobacteraceae bacterium]